MFVPHQEMLDIMKAIYDMMGKCTYPVLQDDAPRQHVETFFQVGICLNPIGKLRKIPLRACVLMVTEFAVIMLSVKANQLFISQVYLGVYLSILSRNRSRARLYFP